MRVEEHTIMLTGAPAFYRTADGENGAPVLYLHGAPTSSDDWQPLLERVGGIAPDLLGFGRSAKGGHLPNTPEALADFVEDLLSALGIDRVRLVTHGWGTVVGIQLAARRPERVQRLVLFNSVPLLEGLRWPWWARLYRMRGVGELAMGSTTRPIMARWLRQGSPQATRLEVGRRLDAIWPQFDQGTQRAILRLVRSIDEERMQALDSALRSLHMPTLMIWGERDPWWDAAVLDAYACRLTEVTVERVPDAGHWPWLDASAVVELAAGFLQEQPSD